MMNTEFKFTDEEFLYVINLILKQDTPLGEEYVPIESMEDRLDCTSNHFKRALRAFAQSGISPRYA